MSATGPNNHDSVMFVFSERNEALRACCRRIEEGGVSVHYAADVFAAMAHLALGGQASHVVVDIRGLDDTEMQFLSLVPRYYPGTDILVPMMDGTAEKASRQSGRLSMLSLPDLIDMLLGTDAPRHGTTADQTEVVDWTVEEPFHPDIPPASETLQGSEESFQQQVLHTESMEDSEIEPSEQAKKELEDRVPAAPEAVSDDDLDIPEAIETTDSFLDTDDVLIVNQTLSTDGEPDAAGAGPSLHEEVRRRMTEAGGASHLRVPPKRKPPSSQMSQEHSHGGEALRPAELTPEEMDALLAEDIRPAGDGTSHPAVPTEGME